MSIPNRNTLWTRVFVDELVKQGIQTACVAPGSRSTPLVTALAERDEIHLFSHLDERSAAYFSLGRARATGRPTPLVSTSGTAAVNFHPAVVEAYHSSVPMLLLTADRPPVLQDSGANQTIDQVRLYGEHVRWFHQVSEPEPDHRKLRALRRVAARAVTRSYGQPAGPVHLNFPFRKPLAPEDSRDVQLEEFVDGSSEDVPGKQDRPIRVSPGWVSAEASLVEEWGQRMEVVDRCLIVAGPDAGGERDRESLLAFSDAHSVPVAADPLSGLRFGPGMERTQVLGGYDVYMSILSEGSDLVPELVFRVGAPPTSTELSRALAETEVEQVIVNSEGAWTDDTFSADEVIESSPALFFDALSDLLYGDQVVAEWAGQLARMERAVFEGLEQEEFPDDFEGGYVRQVLEGVPGRTDLFVSNSMPVRDLDRFGCPYEKDVRVFGNRGASGIDGITSSAIGVGSASERELVLVTGDLAFYHDMNGLVALDRCGVDATLVVINNDGGGIFHMLPIEEFDPPFTEFMKTPHGLSFSCAAEMYGLGYHEVNGPSEFQDAFVQSLDREGSNLINVKVNGEESHRYRERLTEKLQSDVRGVFSGSNGGEE